MYKFSHVLSSYLIFQADLLCIRELLKRNAEWKFYMNHASSELPLITVEEMETFLRSRNRSIIDSYTNKFLSRQKYLYKWKRCSEIGISQCSRLRECCRQVKAGVVSNSRNKHHQTWSINLSRSLYVKFR